ncbi:DUF881 domain-containing protein [Clostridium septicum]|uniref:DUF881 domain-containing protein n=1 Tax=Clostridium septicum TaxID=1504 RepID=A0A9N7JN94_CLOSE|nr:DUF881 domain-containing protein [Clostridium septicum]AYE35613.1 DUF881 domain-containing protein [Clostridium septicum]QAS61000.1 DUF881 domain-containing protein [Clostridium septicum]UEC19721.1 DUF881 domain-containing protein [Clostridium septicum]USS02218.1 DUF881 domain-containing protein [Clostridium septicum]WLF70797.1 DUF881 domain-containing protein [Clostridium septicum]
MRKANSQIVVAIVCALLGFLLAHQFKLLIKKDQINSNVKNSNIVAEIDSLKKEKEELVKSNSTLSEQLKTLEEAAAKKGEVEGEIKKQLDNTRMHLGLVDVKGPGIVITITPKTNIFGSNANETKRDISEEELVHIVNLLWYSRAEAISINDFRITPQTGIKNSGNYIWIGSAGKVDPKDKIVIKAIGEKEKLNVGMTFPGSLDYGALQNYNTEVKNSDDIIINKTTQSLKSEFIKPTN